MPRDQSTLPIVLSLDVGSSSVRCLAFDARGRALPGVTAQRTHAPHLTPDGGVELDPGQLVESALDCLGQVSARVAGQGRAIAGVGVCTFWHAFLGVDAGGRAITPVYMWNDMRAAGQVPWLRARLDARALHGRTGCVPHPSYLPARLLWLRESAPGLYARCHRFLSIGAYLEQHLFGDVRCGLSMASGTGLLDQTRGGWDAELLTLLELEPERLAPLEAAPRPRAGLRKVAADALPHLRDVPFLAAIGDGAASNLGSGACAPGTAAVMLGTSAAMRAFHVGALPPVPEGLWRYHLDGERHLVGGALSNGGNLMGWLGQTLRLPAPRTLARELAQLRPAGHGLDVLPFLFGERNPHYPLEATGMLRGLRGGTTPVQIYQACMEAVAYRLLAIWERLFPLVVPLAPAGAGFIASGGLLRAGGWPQLLADVLGQPVHLSRVGESSARGAALFALEGLGLLEAAHTLPPPLGKTFTPNPAHRDASQAAYARHLALEG